MSAGVCSQFSMAQSFRVLEIMFVAVIDALTGSASVGLTEVHLLGLQRGVYGTGNYRAACKTAAKSTGLASRKLTQ